MGCYHSDWLIPLYFPHAFPPFSIAHFPLPSYWRIFFIVPSHWSIFLLFCPPLPYLDGYVQLPGRRACFRATVLLVESLLLVHSNLLSARLSESIVPQKLYLWEEGEGRGELIVSHAARCFPVFVCQRWSPRILWPAVLAPSSIPPYALFLLVYSL